MNWSEFKTSVKSRLTVDANRQGLSAYVNKMIEDGLREIIRLVPELAVFTREDFSLAGESGFKSLTKEGNVVIGQTTADSEILNAWIISRKAGQNVSVDPGDGDPNRIPLDSYPWENSQDLKHGHLPVKESGYISVSPDGTFYVFPYIKDNEFVRLEFRKKDFSFSDDDVVEFDEPVAEAVGMYVKAMIMREVDHNINMHASYYTDFMKRRAKIKRERAARGELDTRVPDRRTINVTKFSTTPVNQ